MVLHAKIKEDAHLGYLNGNNRPFYINQDATGITKGFDGVVLVLNTLPFIEDNYLIEYILIGDTPYATLMPSQKGLSVRRCDIDILDI